MYLKTYPISKLKQIENAKVAKDRKMTQTEMNLSEQRSKLRALEGKLEKLFKVLLILNETNEHLKNESMMKNKEIHQLQKAIERINTEIDDVKSLRPVIQMEDNNLQIVM